MKSLSRFGILLAGILLAGCATVGGQGFNPGDTPLAKFTHADLKSAAAYAAVNGYPARAAVYLAIEQQLTACEQAMAAAIPHAPAPGATVGVFTAFEIAAEAVGQGIPPAVKINCGAITLP